MSNGVNLDFLCIPLLIGAAVMGSSSSTKVISIILGVIGLGMAGNRFIAITSSDLGGIFSTKRWTRHVFSNWFCYNKYSCSCPERLI